MVFQSIFSFMTDYFTYKFSNKLFKNNEKISKFVLICTLTNWFNFYCGVSKIQMKKKLKKFF